MKKLNYMLLGLAGLALASCSQDEVVAPGMATGDGNFTVTVKLPSDLGTRALGDGMAADNLHFAVYDVTTGSPVFSFEDEATFDNSLQTTLNLNLITGKKYQLAFFACSPAAEDVYTFSPSNKDGATPVIEVNYENMTGAEDIADAYDCFFKLTETYIVGTSENPYEVLLTRPVAQINWGTSELGDNNEIDVTFGDEGQYIETNASIEGEIYTQFNILDGDVAQGSQETITLFGNNQALIPTGTAFPVSPSVYDYVAVQYVLAPKYGTTYGLTLNISNGANGGPADQNIAVQVLNAPVQANYRTNIYGNLLSTNATFNVTKSQFFTGENNLPYPEVWDGASITYPAITTNPATPVEIAGPSDLAGLAAWVSGKASLPEGITDSSFEGYTFTLGTDLDMGGYALSIGSASRSSSNVSGKSFSGVLDGQGYTISNISLEGTGASGEIVGFIPSLAGSGAAVKDIIFDNFTIDAAEADQAGVVGVVSDGATVSGVKVTSGSITSYEAAGGIVGRMITSGTVEDCENSATITAGHYHAGGIVGAAYYGEAGKTMTIKGCTNNGKIICTGETKDWGMETAAGIVGYSSANVISCINNGEVQSGVSPTGGIVGWQKEMGSIEGCVNNASVSGGCLVGGIAGLVETAVDKGITVSGNTNKGNVTGIGRYGSQAGGVGGIIGSCGSKIICINNTNSAPSLNGMGPDSSGNYVAGILGQANTAWQATEGPYVSGNINKTPLGNMQGDPKAELYNGVTLNYTGD